MYNRYIPAQMLWQRFFCIVEYHIVEADAREREFVRSRIVLQDHYTSLWQERPPL